MESVGLINFNWLKRLDFGPVERCGLVLIDGSVVEIENKHELPANNFRMLSEDILPYEGKITATWHTHLDGNFNLSLNDYECFTSLADLSHYIISSLGVAEYKIKNNELINFNHRIF